MDTLQVFYKKCAATTRGDTAKKAHGETCRKRQKERMMKDVEDKKKLDKGNNRILERMSVQIEQHNRKRVDYVDQYMQGAGPATNEKREPKCRVTRADQIETEKRTQGNKEDDKVPTTAAKRERGRGEM